MVLLDEGLEELANQFQSLVTKGQWGTGTTAASSSDTGLETAVAATLLDVSAVASGPGTQFTHVVGSTVANSNSLTEFELRFANGDSLNRVVGSEIDKISSIEITTISSINFVRNN